MTGTNKAKPRKPRKTRHVPPDEPTPREPDGMAPGAEGLPEGLLDGRAGADVSHVGNVAGGGHTPAGKFAPGNRFGKGNPNARRVHDLRMQFLDAVHPDTIPMLAKRLQIQALSGDLDAMKLLLDYTLGRPQQAVALTDADGGPLGVTFTAIKAVLLGAFADDAAKRLELARQLMELDDAGGDA